MRNNRSDATDSNVDRRSIESSTRYARSAIYTRAIVLAAVRNIRRIWQQQSAIPCAKLLDPFSQSRERERELTRTLSISGRIDPIDFNHTFAIESPSTPLASKYRFDSLTPHETLSSGSRSRCRSSEIVILRSRGMLRWFQCL